jgi:hypothetical protein
LAILGLLFLAPFGLLFFNLAFPEPFMEPELVESLETVTESDPLA